MNQALRALAGRHRVLAGLLTVAIYAMVMSGCGGSGEGAAPKTAISLKPPTTPVKSDCGLTGAGTPGESDTPPRPGKYEYELRGTRRVVSETTTTKQLPRTMQIIITDSLRRGGQSCYAMQRRYDEALGETGVFVINGSDYYMRSGTFQAGGDITEVVPRPSILMFSGDQLDWSGTFSGATSGRYRAEVLGRKQFKIDGRRVKAAQIESRISYSGEIEGSDDAVRWVALDSGLVLAETVRQSRAFGLDTLKLNFKSRLTSLDPQ